ncbi:MAG: UDP-N-acetylglucosamine 1-carboxyvinyltransferase [Burkholderiales bacterium]|nr:UDP-N-acetylglucosamine 1-carboxyvinyltransferase [Burkholderiales bacterium]
MLDTALHLPDPAAPPPGRRAEGEARNEASAPAAPAAPPEAVLHVHGGRVLEGAVRIEGAKISAVSMLAATLLTDEPVALRNVPQLEDMAVMTGALRFLGAGVAAGEGRLDIGCASVDAERPLPAAWMNSVHGTLYLLPALLARHERVRVPLTRGGCSIGVRPVAHVAKVLRAMGAKVRLGETIEAWLPEGRFVGTTLDLQALYGEENNKFISGATKTALLVGALAEGSTVIRGAYWRRCIRDLCTLLRAMGARISGDGSREIRIEGVPRLHGADLALPFDPLVLGTYIGAAGITGSRITCTQASLDGLEVEAAALRAMGMHISVSGDAVVCHPERALTAVDITTEQVDSDLGPVFAALMSVARGRSSIEEVVWENRFRHAVELRRLGGRNRVEGRRLLITGVPRLTGARLMARDLRGAAGLLLAAAAAEGCSELRGIHHLRRGYEDLPGRLAALGGRIRAGAPGE